MDIFNLLKDNIYNAVLVIVFFIFLLFLLFPLEKILSDVLKTKISKVQVLVTLLFISLLVIIIFNPFNSFVVTVMAVFSLSVFLFGVLSDRKYIYTLSLVMLGLTPVALILGSNALAEYFSEACYLLLVLGVLKDIFYEKIFE